MIDSGEQKLEIISRMREDALNELRKLAPTEAGIFEALDNLREKLRSAETAGASYDGKSHAEVPEDYSGFSRPTDAIAAYLAKHGPSPKLPAIHAIVEGGWHRGHEDAATLLRVAVQHQHRRATNPVIGVKREGKQETIYLTGKHDAR